MSLPRATPDSAIGIWLDQHGYSLRSAADKLGISRRALQRFCLGRGVPKLRIAIRIEDFTDGAVHVRTWFENERHV